MKPKILACLDWYHLRTHLDRVHCETENVSAFGLVPFMNSLFLSLLQKQTKEAANQGQKFYSASPNTLFLTLMFFYQIIKKTCDTLRKTLTL